MSRLQWITNPDAALRVPRRPPAAQPDSAFAFPLADMHLTGTTGRLPDSASDLDFPEMVKHKVWSLHREPHVASPVITPRSTCG